MVAATGAEYLSAVKIRGIGNELSAGSVLASFSAGGTDDRVRASSPLLRRIAALTRMLDARDHTIHALIHRLEDVEPQGGNVLEASAHGPAADASEHEYLQKTLDKLHQAQLRLMQAQKMVSIGQLAAGIAHELNTPIQYVADNVTFLDRAFKSLLLVLDGSMAVVAAAKVDVVPPELIQTVEQAFREGDLEFLRADLPDAIDQSREGLKRIASIVSAMKKFSHPSNDVMALADLTEIIETTVVVARNEWKYVADVETHFADDLPEVVCIRDEIGKVVLNLIVNAAHAIGDAIGPECAIKGKITISTQRVDDFVEITIADSGRGIPAAIRDRVFDPFFTTKSVGVGTGQGLAIAHATIVDQHHGQIFFDCPIGGGTIFHVRLPLLLRVVGERG
jgi:two-component system NtrC family sensor kinase